MPTRNSRPRARPPLAPLDPRPVAHAGDPLRHRLIAGPRERGPGGGQPGEPGADLVPAPAGVLLKARVTELDDRREVTARHQLEELQVPLRVDVRVRIPAHRTDRGLTGRGEGADVPAS